MYTEKQLVSFGNSLLERYGVKTHSADGKNEPLFNREVSHADVENWKEDFESNTVEHRATLFPSRYDIGEQVRVCLLPDGEETFPGIPAVITAIHFTESKVKYDLQLNFSGEYSTRIYNVDSILVVDL